MCLFDVPFGLCVGFTEKVLRVAVQSCQKVLYFYRNFEKVCLLECYFISKRISKILVCANSYMHDLLDCGPEAAGREIVELARHCDINADYRAEMRKYLMPDDMSESEYSEYSERNSGSDPSEPGSD